MGAGPDKILVPRDDVVMFSSKNNALTIDIMMCQVESGLRQISITITYTVVPCRGSTPSSAFIALLGSWIEEQL